MTQQYGPGPQQPAPGWAPMGATPHPPPQKRNGFAIAALALGLVGLVFSLMPITALFGLGAGLLALLFALLSVARWRRGQASKGLTITGLVLSILATVLAIFSLSLFFDAVDDLAGSDSPPAAVGAPVDPADPAAGEDGAQQFTVGQTVERDGVQLTAEPLRKEKPQYGEAMVCSRVSYRNGSDTEQSFNPFDWKIQSPDGVQAPATWAQDDALQSGQLAPGGNVAGDVCATGPGTAGDYLIINEAMFSDPVRWTATL